MATIMSQMAHVATASINLRIAVLAIAIITIAVAGQAFLNIGGLLHGWMASAGPFFAAAGSSRVMTNPGLAAGVRVIVARLATAVLR